MRIVQKIVAPPTVRGSRRPVLSSERLMCALVGEPSPLLSAFPLAWSKPSDSSGKRQSLSALVEAATTDCNSKDTGRGRIHRQKRVSSSTDAPHGPKR